MAKKQRTGMTEERRERAAEALKLRKQGMTVTDIAERQGVSIATTSQDISLSLKEITREPAEEVRDMELQRLDEMLVRLNTELAHIAKARKSGEEYISSDKAANSVARIVDAQLKVQERRARLLGLETIRAEVATDVAGAIRDALGTITAPSEEELIASIGEEV